MAGKSSAGDLPDGTVVERLVRIETKLDGIAQQQSDSTARIAKAEGLIQGLERSDAVITSELASIKAASSQRDTIVQNQGKTIDGLQMVVWRAIGGGAVLLAVVQIVIAFLPRFIK